MAWRLCGRSEVVGAFGWYTAGPGHLDPVGRVIFPLRTELVFFDRAFLAPEDFGFRELLAQFEVSIVTILKPASFTRALLDVLGAADDRHGALLLSVSC